MKNEIKVKKGKMSRPQGNAFENRVRLDLEEKGWVVAKWMNQVEFETIAESVRKQIELTGSGWLNGKVGKLVPAKPKYLFINGSMKMVGNKSGFPDFIAFTHKQVNIDVSKPFEEESVDGDIPTIIGVESKMTGDLDKAEKEKCVWLLENKIFSKILIARKTKVKNKIVIVYEDFKEKYWRFYGSKD